MDVKELTNQIYDKLLDNVGMSKYHVEFFLSSVTDCYVGSIGKPGKIHLKIDGEWFTLTVKKEKNYGIE